MNTIDLASSLRSSISVLHKSMRNQLLERHIFSLTEMETIGHLMRNESLLPTELANLTKIKTQSMSEILKKMDERGIIDRTPSEKDKRKVYISLNETGKKLVEETRDERDLWLRNIIENSLTEKERQALEDALPVLQKLIENK